MQIKAIFSFEYSNNKFTYKLSINIMNVAKPQVKLSLHQEISAPNNSTWLATIIN